MGRFCKRYLTINQEDYRRADQIMTKLYEQGDIDSVTVEFGIDRDTVLIGLECSTDDYLFIAKELGIEFK